MKLIKGSVMKSVDARAINEIGMAEAVLVENAGRAVCEGALELLEGDARDRKITVLSGKGNNGADGLAAARDLAAEGAQVSVILAEPPAAFGPGAALQLRILQYMPGCTFVEWAKEPERALSLCRESDLILDGLLGTSFHGVPREPLKSLIEAVNDLHKTVLAIDIPSGVEADTGASVLALQADVTVTMIAPKHGLYLYPGARYAGEIYLAGLNVPPCLVEEAPGAEYLLEPEMVRDWLPRRRADAHKGVNGRIAVLAGSLGYAGAAELCSKAVVRAGGGLVTLYTRQEVLEPLIIKNTEVMVRPQPSFDPKDLLPLLANADVVAAGPGMGKDPRTQQLLRELLPQLDQPLVLDADGLNALAGQDDLLRSLKRKIFTPHPGEMARLLGRPIGEILKHPLECAREGAEKWQAVVVLKCTPAVIALLTGELYINTTGNAGMATGGCGDVLTGTVAALLGQGLNLEKAACCAVYAHGLAGDLAAEERGQIGLKAGDLLEQLPQAIAKILEV